MKFIKKILVVMLIFMIMISTIFSSNLKVYSANVGDPNVEVYYPPESSNDTDKLKEDLYNKCKKYGYTGTKEDIKLNESVAKWSTTITLYKNTWSGWQLQFGDYVNEGSTTTEDTIKSKYGYPYEEFEQGTSWNIHVVVESNQHTNGADENLDIGNFTAYFTFYSDEQKDEFDKVDEQEGEDLTISEVIEQEDEHYDDEDDSDIGGILLEPIVWFVNLIADAAQSLVTAFMRDDIGWRAILQGKRLSSISSSIDGKMKVMTHEGWSDKSKHIKWYYEKKGIEYTLLEVKASDTASDIEWPSSANTNMSGNGIQAYYRTDGVVSGSDVEDYDGSLGGNEYFINAVGYKNRYSYPLIAYSPEEIFAGDVEILNANFLSSSESSGSAFTIIRNVIRGWFRALRYLGLAGLLSVLIYTGIKIMTSSVSQDKAKYKESLSDWLVALCLVVIIHFIMAGIMMFVDSITSMLSNANKGIYVEVEDSEGTHTNEAGKKVLSFRTNLTGYIRFMAQSKDFGYCTAYTIIYLALVIYTCMFTVTYFKRFLYMAFFTMIAPLVALTYPIDKARR